LQTIQGASMVSNRALSQASAVSASRNVVSTMIQREKSKPPKKSLVQTRFDILVFLYYHAGAHLRTALWRHATRLSYDDFQVHLASLEDKGFVEESEGGIRLTLAGKEIYLKLREVLPSIL
jgi:DNA-binding MarR family transcriptional regulator